MAHEPDFRDMPVTVLGLGVEGIDLVRFLAARGARVTVSDSRPESALRDALDSIADSIEQHDVSLALGGNRAADLVSAQCVYVSQGVPPDLPALREARERGVPISSMSRLFFELCPAPIAAVTGSSGKTTTVALAGAMLERAGLDHVIGGNIGVGMLGLLERVGPETRVVIELSHTQLESLERSPHIACLTNVTPNHLDRYSWVSYVGLKRRIFEYQREGDLAIFSLDDEVCSGFASEAPAGVAYTSLSRPLPGDGAALEHGQVVLHECGRSRPVLAREQIALPGEHNVANVLSALALASRLGVDDEAAADAVRGFRGVEHRLETVATVGGVTYVNDSIATTPERAIAGLRSFARPIVLLLGGRDKQLPLRELAAEAMARCRAVIAFGEAGELYAAAMRDAGSGSGPPVERVEDVERAVRRAARSAQEGDVVLLSPAGTSFDAYPNFERRGEAFRDAVAALEQGS